MSATENISLRGLAANTYQEQAGHAHDECDVMDCVVTLCYTSWKGSDCAAKNETWFGSKDAVNVKYSVPASRTGYPLRA